ncbi:MAG: MBL fold metallo-hydrolase [Candidatus Hodarchaeota archaeon]
MVVDFKVYKVTDSTAFVLGDEFNEFTANAAGVALKNFVVAIDPTPMPDTANLFRKKLEAHFNLPVKYLFITHYHLDHIFGVAPFKDTTIVSSSVLSQAIQKKLESQWAPEAFQKWKEQEPEKSEVIDSIEIILPHQTFQDTFEINDESLQVSFFYTGGHTRCSSYAYFPHEKVLFAGDLIFAKSFPWAGDETCDPDVWIQVLKDFLELDFEKLVPGHGPIVGKETVKDQLKFLEDLKKATIEAISTGKDKEGIQVPEYYTPEEKDMWVKTRTIEYFFNFYKEKTI